MPGQAKPEVYPPTSAQLDHMGLICLMQYRTDRTPVYLRMGKSDRGDAHQQAITFKAGQLLPLSAQPKKIALIATGSMVFTAQALVQQGLDAEVWIAPSIKQMDSATLAGISRRVDCIITLEEHSVLNGLGSAVAELVAEARPLPVYRIGINDKF